MSKLTNKIEADDRTVAQVLNEKKYEVDFFQREYNWEAKHVEELITDLTGAFLNEYSPDDSRPDGENYNNYYLGPFVVNEKNGKRSIIDGQQRLTSITLLLIYLNNLQKKLGLNETIEPLIFSELRGSKSFNIQVEERIDCLDQLFSGGNFQCKEEDDESTINMVNRYYDIEEAFPEEIKGKMLPFFIDWLKHNVVLVEIVAYSDDNAYTIFETMNDRGLNLTPTEMLKGFLLSRFKELQTRHKANAIWKNNVQLLHCYDKDEDQRFFQAWLRSQYAETIRPGKAGSKNEDFEKIGTRFHSWVRDNLETLSLKPETTETFEKFVFVNFKFYLNAYLKILNAEENFCLELENIFYIKRYGIATSLSYPLLLAPLDLNDTEEDIAHKMNLVAQYIEIFVVRRSVNFRKFASSSIRYTMYTLVKEIRRKSIDELKEILKGKLDEMEESWEGFSSFRLHGQNRRFVKFLLSRIITFIEKNSGININFETYFESPEGQPFEVEHIWANKFDEHIDEFTQKTDFDECRNRLGCLVLLPRGTNQSYGAKSYSEKLDHYIKENLLVRSLCELTYKNNPNFLTMCGNLNFPFEPHNEFKKFDVTKRQKLYQQICEKIWRLNLI